MASPISLVLKVLLLSTVIAILIKYGGASLNLPATSGTAIGLVLLPTIVMAIALGWRAYNDSRRSRQDRLI
jgi:hypothetical protein